MSSESLSIAASLEPLLTSNDAPHLSQSVVVEGVLRARQTELSKLEDDINRLESALKVLRMNHDNLKTEMDGYKSILSPIRRVPPEIIAEIFRYFVPYPDPTIKRHPLSFQKVSPPWKLGQICRRWRMIAVTLHELWAFLDIAPFNYEIHNFDETYSALRPDSIDDGFAPELDVTGFGDLFMGQPWTPCEPRIREDAYGFQIQAALELLEGFFSRRGSRPFSLRLRSRASVEFIALDSVISRSALWQELILHDPSIALVDYVRRHDLHLQGLRKMVLVDSGGHLLLWPVIRYEAAVNLTDLTLVGATIVPTSNISNLPLSQLTRYCEIRCSWDQFKDNKQERLSFYRKLTNLKVFRVDAENLNFFQWPTIPVVLRTVRSASLRLRSPYTTIRKLQMPHLEDFSIEYARDRYNAVLSSPFSALQALVPTPGSQLKILRIHSLISLPACNFAGVLEEHLPNLVELYIDFPNLISNTLVSGFIPHGIGQLPLAAKLEIIHLSNRSFVNRSCPWQTLVDMLQARFRPTVCGVSQLRTFKFQTDTIGSHDVDVVAGLRTLRKRHHWDIRVGPECVFPAWDEWRT
ncbi:hypothetical protein R3P38DRAFT_2599950 [Favolaschia claudopus]|uniref:F-box domain-containing protein n=1 Tax=Favolaschia claudopus TaxID=2862362 RepID=A0AAW0DUY0_9AGAR